RTRGRGRAKAFSLLGLVARQFSQLPTPFEIILPDGSVHRFGQGAPSFQVRLKNQRALRAVRRLDEGRFGDAYVAGDIDIDGDMLRPFELRRWMKDFHVVTTVWRFAQPFLLGQVWTNRRAIASHYDIDPDFFLSFLDPKVPCYTQGVFEHARETLEAAT